jgi:anti-sigma B factor antagonist
MFCIDERKSQGWTILDVTGKVQAGGPEGILRDKVKSLVLNGCRNILINMQGVPSVDSMGLGTLIAAKISVDSGGGRLELVHLTQRIQDLMAMAGLLSYFSAFGSEQEAMAAPRRQPALSAR